MISPVAQNLFNSSLYPKAIGTGLQQNAVNSKSSAFDVDQGDIKADYKPNEKDTISGRFTRAYQNNPSTNSQVLLGNDYHDCADLEHRWQLDANDQHQSCQ